MLKITTAAGCTPLNIDDFYIKHVISGLDELIFNIPLEHEAYHQIVEEAIVEYEQPYLIKAIDAGSKSAKVKCQLNLDELKQTLNPTYSNDSDTLMNTVAGVLPNGWTYKDHTNVTIRRTIEGAYTPYDVLMQCMTTYDVVMRFDVAKRKVDIYRLKEFKPLGAFASRQLNLKQIDYKGKSSNFCTRLYAYGKDGLSFADINNGKPYVENFIYSNKVICGSWIDERYEDPESLLADAQAKVDAVAVPESSYTCAVYDLAAVEPEIYGFQDFSLFSVIRLIDDNKKIMVNHQVVEYCRYPFYPEKNIVTLSATAPKISNLVKDLQTSVSNIKNDLVTTETHMEQAIKNATDMITGNKGGNVVFCYGTDGNLEEILIMNTDSIETATKCWRWNLSGLGYSKNGYNGPYEMALTIDGEFVADGITVRGLVVGKNVTMGENASISWNQVTEQPDIPDDKHITQITKDTVTTEYVNALKVKAASVDAEDITGTTIKGKTITGSKVISDSADTVYSIEINDGVISVYGSKNGTKMLVGQISSVGTIGDTSNTYDGLGLFGAYDASRLSFGFASDSSNKNINIYYRVNNGTDPDGYSERHVWWGAERHLGVSYGEGMVFNYGTGVISSKYIGISESGEVYYPGFLLGVNGNVYIAVGLTAKGGINCDALQATNGITSAYVFASGGMQCTTFVATGTKSRLTDTEDYGKRLLYCYETPTPMFGDIGEGQLDDTGKCFVFLDDIFAETIDTDCRYQVFLQPYGKGECYVTERNTNYFVVEGTENLSFGWEVKAVQRDFDTMRLEEYEEPTSDGVAETLSETETYLNSLLYNVENIDLEREDVDYE